MDQTLFIFIAMNTNSKNDVVSISGNISSKYLPFLAQNFKRLHNWRPAKQVVSKWRQVLEPVGVMENGRKDPRI